MKFDISGHHCEITPPLRDYVTQKVDRIVRHFDNVTDVHVVLTVEKLVQKAEATIHVKGAKLFADSQDADMYAAIDALADKLDRQVLKFKEKLKDHHK